MIDLEHCIYISPEVMKTSGALYVGDYAEGILSIYIDFNFKIIRIYIVSTEIIMQTSCEKFRGWELQQINQMMEWIKDHLEGIKFLAEHRDVDLSCVF